jgi:hypothetical protein
MAGAIDVILSALTWIGAVTGALALVLLIAPLRMRINAMIDDRQGYSYALDADWALGVLALGKREGSPWRLSILGLRAMRFPAARKQRSKRAKRTRPKRISPRSVAASVKNHFQTFTRVLDDVAGAAFVRGGLRGRIGLADPADTAKFELIGHLANQRFKRFNLLLACDYETQVIQIDATVQATLILGYVGLVAGKLMLQKQTRMALRSLRRA